MEELRIYQGGYSDEELRENGLEIVCWPESQDMMELNGFREHSELINDDDGLDAYGSSAYVVETKWLDDCGDSSLDAR